MIEGIGGPEMAAAEATILDSLDSMSVMGLVEGVRSLPVHLHLLRKVRQRLGKHSYDLAVLIDYPGFHLRVAAAARRAGVPVLYFIAPQMWAWGESRVRSLRENVAALAVILPFEEQFFRNRGVEAEFVGHPLLDRPIGNNSAALRVEWNMSAKAPVLGLLPGSRSSEVRRLWPAFRDAAIELRHAEPGVQIVVAAKPGIRYPGGDGFVFVRDRSRDVLTASDVAICKSGTTTLEAALLETPMVVAYRLHPLTYVVARQAIRVSNIGLVNLLAGRTVAPELIQQQVTAENLFETVRPLLDRSGEAATEQRRALGEIRDKLGRPGVSGRVADLACRLVV